MFAKYYKYGNEINSHDLLKFSAIIFMIVDHLGRYIFPENDWFRLVGRFAAPTFLFLIGYSLNYKFKKSLLFWAGGLIVFTGLINHPILPVNILVTIILARLFLNWAEEKGYLESQLLAIFLILVIWWALTFPLFDYGTQCFLFAICGYLVAKGSLGWQTKILFLVTALFYILLQQVFMKFDVAQTVLLTIGISGLFFMFFNYKLRSYNYSGFLKAPVIFVSRYSLEFYVIHLIILQVIAAFVIDAGNYQVFKWIE